MVCPALRLIHAYRNTVCAVRQYCISTGVTCVRYFNWITRLDLSTAIDLYFMSLLNHHHPVIGAGRTEVDFDLVRNGVSLW